MSHRVPQSSYMPHGFCVDRIPCEDTAARQIQGDSSNTIHRNDFPHDSLSGGSSPCPEHPPPNSDIACRPPSAHNTAPKKAPPSSTLNKAPASGCRLPAGVLKATGHLLQATFTLQEKVRLQQSASNSELAFSTCIQQTASSDRSPRSQRLQQLCPPSAIMSFPSQQRPCYELQRP